MPAALPGTASASFWPRTSVLPSRVQGYREGGSKPSQVLANARSGSPCPATTVFGGAHAGSVALHGLHHVLAADVSIAVSGQGRRKGGSKPSQCSPMHAPAPPALPPPSSEAGGSALTRSVCDRSAR